MKKNRVLFKMTDSYFKSNDGQKLARIETFPIELAIDSSNNDQNNNANTKSSVQEETATSLMTIGVTAENAAENLIVSS